jgi:hypothetical protein
MDKKGMRQVTPMNRGETAVAPFVENFSSGYMQRALASWPRQGSKAPWRVYQNYFRDALILKWTSVEDGVLEFSNPPKASSNSAPRELAETARS